MLVLAFVSACWSTPGARPPSSEAPFPGALWITPRQPWRVTERPTALAVLGSTAVIGGTEGWIGVLDLTTGKLLREKHLGNIAITDIERLRDGRLILVGIGATTQLGQVFLTKGLMIERAGRATSIGYLQICFAVLWQLIVFNQTPGLGTLLGAALIIGGTLAVSATAKRDAPPAPTAT